MGKPPAQILGKRFSRLLVIEQLPNINGRTNWLCECDCGVRMTTAPGPLRDGRTKSCGCLRRRILATSTLRHGMSNTKTHRIWRGMLKRCVNGHPRYGGRGIRVCDRWQLFENFLSDMGECPVGNYSIERINNDGNYEPSNCKWLLMALQHRNTSRTVWITINNERKSLVEWCSIYNIRYSRVRDRIKFLGWEPLRSLTEKKHA